MLNLGHALALNSAVKHRTVRCKLAQFRPFKKQPYAVLAFELENADKNIRKLYSLDLRLFY